MRLLIKQRVFSWTDSYDVYDEEQKQIMPEIIRTCHQFVNGFDQEFKNILFYGSVGTPVTHI